MAKGYIFELRDSDGNDCTVYDAIIEAESAEAALEELMRKVGRTRYAKAVQFFYTHAGYSYDPATETKEQGKRARQLAKAEKWAHESYLNYEWVEDYAGCSGCECDSPDCTCSTGEPHETLTCLLWNEEHTEILASLGGICGATSEYRRVVEAELALEAMYR